MILILVPTPCITTFRVNFFATMNLISCCHRPLILRCSDPLPSSCRWNRGLVFWKFRISESALVLVFDVTVRSWAEKVLIVRILVQVRKTHSLFGYFELVFTSSREMSLVLINHMGCELNVITIFQVQRLYELIRRFTKFWFRSPDFRSDQVLFIPTAF